MNQSSLCSNSGNHSVAYLIHFHKIELEIVFVVLFLHLKTHL